MPWAIRCCDRWRKSLNKCCAETTCYSVTVVKNSWFCCAPHPPKDIKVTVSIGAATLGAEGGDGLFERSDHALYQAKQQGRNRVVVAQ